MHHVCCCDSTCHPFPPCLHTLPYTPFPNSIRARFEKVIRDAQDSICAAVSEIDGKPFQQDAWTREDGGGGITRVLAVSDTLCEGALAHV